MVAPRWRAGWTSAGRRPEGARDQVPPGSTDSPRSSTRRTHAGTSLTGGGNLAPAVTLTMSERDAESRAHVGQSGDEVSVLSAWTSHAPDDRSRRRHSRGLVLFERERGL